MKEREIILDPIIPFFINKYNVLIDWAESKSNREGVELKEILFEKRFSSDTEWDVYLIVPGWSNNEANKMIQYILMKHYREFSIIQGIEINYVGYATFHSVNDSHEYLRYDVKFKMERKY